MSFASPLGLLALLAIPAIIALHMFRRRFRERRVAGLFLFAPDRLRAAAGRRRTRLLRSTSLLLELAAAMFAALWLGGLSFGATSRAVHAVFVLDDSASMAAEERGVSAADRVRRELRKVIDDLPTGAFATVIVTGQRPEILAGPRELAPAVLPAVDDWRPWRPQHDPAAALDLGVELAGADGQVWFFTDHLEPAHVPERCTIRAVGRKVPNVALLATRRSVSTSGETLYADVCAYTGTTVETRLAVHAIAVDGVKTLAERALTLEPDRPMHVSIDLPALAVPLTVELSNDALAIDSTSTLLPRPARVVHVAMALDDGVARALEAERVLAALPDVEQTELAQAHVVLGIDPSAARHQVVFEIPAGAERDAWLGPYLIERRDPLCDGLTLDGVVWTAGRGSLPGFPVVLAGQQALVTRELLGDRVCVTLNLDPLRSNFATSPDWPILLSNVCEHARAVLPGAEEVNVAVGGLLRWREQTGEARQLRLVDPLGRERPGRGLRLVTWRAEHPGEHRLLRGGDEVARFSVNFSDAGESDLRGCDEGTREAVQGEKGVVADAGMMATGRIEGRWLALLMLVAVLADWFVLRRGMGTT